MRRAERREWAVGRVVGEVERRGVREISFWEGRLVFLRIWGVGGLEGGVGLLVLWGWRRGVWWGERGLVREPFGIADIFLFFFPENNRI